MVERRGLAQPALEAALLFLAPLEAERVEQLDAVVAPRVVAGRDRHPARRAQLSHQRRHRRRGHHARVGDLGPGGDQAALHPARDLGRAVAGIAAERHQRPIGAGAQRLAQRPTHARDGVGIDRRLPKLPRIPSVPKIELMRTRGDLEATRASCDRLGRVLRTQRDRQTLSTAARAPPRRGRCSTQHLDQRIGGVERDRLLEAVGAPPDRDRRENGIAALEARLRSLDRHVLGLRGVLALDRSRRRLAARVGHHAQPLLDLAIDVERDAVGRDRDHVDPRRPRDVTLVEHDLLDAGARRQAHHRAHLERREVQDRLLAAAHAHRQRAGRIHQDVSLRRVVGHRHVGERALARGALAAAVREHQPEHDRGHQRQQSQRPQAMWHAPPSPRPPRCAARAPGACRDSCAARASPGRA